MRVLSRASRSAGVRAPAQGFEGRARGLAFGAALGALVVLGALVAGALGFGAAAAHASDSYVPGAVETVSSPVVESGGSTTISFSKGYFQPNERVQVSIQGTGELPVVSGGSTDASPGGSAEPSASPGGPGAPSAAPVVTAYADASGSLEVTASFQQGAVGDYSVTVAGASSGAVGTASFSVVSPGGTSGVAPRQDRLTLYILIGVGVLLVGGAAFGIYRFARRPR